MQFTAAEFAKLINDLKCDIRPGERRNNPRAPTRAKVQVLPVVVGQKSPRRLMIWVRDVSRTGIGLVANETFQEGSRLMILLPKDAGENFNLLCEVVRVVRMPGDTFVIGTRMVRRVSTDEFDQFIAGNSESVIALTTAA
jgi:PilZ domain